MKEWGICIEAQGAALPTDHAGFIVGWLVILAPTLEMALRDAHALMSPGARVRMTKEWPQATEEDV